MLSYIGTFEHGLKCGTSLHSTRTALQKNTIGVLIRWKGALLRLGPIHKTVIARHMALVGLLNLQNDCFPTKLQPLPAKWYKTILRYVLMYVCVYTNTCIYTVCPHVHLSSTFKCICTLVQYAHMYTCTASYVHM